MVKINYSSLQVDLITNSSGIFTGQNLQLNWKAYIENNSGLGGLNGNANQLANPKNILIKAPPSNKPWPLLLPLNYGGEAMWWFDFFKKITKKKKRNEQLLAELKHKVKKMEQIIQNINNKSPEYHINIEKIMIENPQLDNLTFRLDKLDIKELGGALNMGNNFGIEVVKDQKHKKQSKDNNSKINNIQLIDKNRHN